MSEKWTGRCEISTGRQKQPRTSELEQKRDDEEDDDDDDKMSFKEAAGLFGRTIFIAHKAGTTLPAVPYFQS